MCSSDLVDQAMASMEPEDRLILKMRFWHAAKVPDIAAALHIDQKKLYKRIDRLIAALRDALLRAGISREDIGDLLTHADHNLTLHAEKRGPRPSKVKTGISVRAQPGGRVDHAD